MKRIKTFGGMLCAAVFVMGGLLSTSCNKTEKENPGEPLSPEVKDPVTFTVEAEASYYSATVTGTVSEIVAGAEYGVVYGTAENPEVVETTPSEAIEIAEDKTFTIGLADLTEGTTYHYRAYICEDGAYTYSEDATFDTKAFPVVAITSAESYNSKITYTFAKLADDKNLPAGYEIGVEHSSSPVFAPAQTETLKLIDFIGADLTTDDYDDLAGVYKKGSPDIAPFATYYYRPYVKDLTTGDVKYYEGGEPIVSTMSMTISYLPNGRFGKSFKIAFSDATFMPNAEGYVFGVIVSTTSDFDATTEGVTVYAPMTPSADMDDYSNAGFVVYAKNVELATGKYYYRGYFQHNGTIVYYTDIAELTI